MDIIAIIPARMGSSRFPGKPMKEINGKPMIGHVYERVAKCRLLNKTIVATCDKIIFDYVNSIGGVAIMTSNKHERASDRCAEALRKIEKLDNKKYEIMVMVQGDEPMTHHKMISESIKPFKKDPKLNIVNLMAKINTKEEFNDRNCIKVVFDKDSYALYFSREPIPTFDKSSHKAIFKQVCIIPFRRNFLFKYNNLKPTKLEIIESIDMLRILENGLKVKMVHTKYETNAVDTYEDLKRVESLMRLMD